MAASLDLAAFFASVRNSPFPGSLTQGQVQGMEAILGASPPDMPLDFLAYCLGTCPIETGWKMLPVTENLNYTAARIREVWPTRFASVEAARPYERNPRALANKVYNGRMGNRVGSDDGYAYRGRGLPQITGRANYEKADKRLKELGYLLKTESLIDDPDLALRPDIAAAILLIGASEGWYTGKKLSDYFGNGKADWKGARAIINGEDRAGEIALHAQAFAKALKAAGYKPGAVTKSLPTSPVTVTPVPAVKPVNPPPAPPVPANDTSKQPMVKTGGLLAWISSLFGKAS